MKLLHTADLHIGKGFFEYSLLEDQRWILQEILAVAKEEAVDAVLVAGDVYDRSVPSAEAVTVLSDFLTALCQAGIAVFAVAGNHDSPERLEFGAELLSQEGCHIAGRMPGAGRGSRFVMEDPYGKVNFYLLPYARPLAAGTGSTAEAVQGWMASLGVDPRARNVLVTHYFVTSQGKMPEQSESEQDIFVGGLDSVDVTAFSGFDYVALGHIHRPQQIGCATVRYAGAPLQYSFSEAGHEKSVAIVELAGKDEVSVRLKKLHPLRELRCIRGPLAELTTEGVLEEAGRADFIQATLTDERELLEPAAALRSVYPNICQVLFKRPGEEPGRGQAAFAAVRQKSRLELVREFYSQVSGQPWTEEKEALLRETVQELEQGGAP